MSEYIGHFSLWGDFAVDEITHILGLEPSQVFLKGDILEGASAPSTVSTWDLHSPPESRGSMREQVSALLDILASKERALLSLTSRFHAELNIASSCIEGSSVLSLDH